MLWILLPLSESSSLFQNCRIMSLNPHCNFFPRGLGSKSFSFLCPPFRNSFNPSPYFCLFNSTCLSLFCFLLFIIFVALLAFPPCQSTSSEAISREEAADLFQSFDDRLKAHSRDPMRYWPIQSQFLKEIAEVGAKGILPFSFQLFQKRVEGSKPTGSNRSMSISVHITLYSLVSSSSISCSRELLEFDSLSISSVFIPKPIFVTFRRSQLCLWPCTLNWSRTFFWLGDSSFVVFQTPSIIFNFATLLKSRSTPFPLSVSRGNDEWKLDAIAVTARFLPSCCSSSIQGSNLVRLFLFLISPSSPSFLLPFSPLFLHFYSSLLSQSVSILASLHCQRNLPPSQRTRLLPAPLVEDPPLPIWAGSCLQETSSTSSSPLLKAITIVSSEALISFPSFWAALGLNRRPQHPTLSSPLLKLHRQSELV